MIYKVLAYSMSLYKDGKTVMEVDSNTIANLYVFVWLVFYFFNFLFKGDLPWIDRLAEKIASDHKDRHNFLPSCVPVT